MASGVMLNVVRLNDVAPLIRSPMSDSQFKIQFIKLTINQKQQHDVKNVHSGKERRFEQY
jgi:hypothetical protein